MGVQRIQSGSELGSVRRELLCAQRRLGKTRAELERAREKLRVHVSHERTATSTSRALSRRTHELGDYVAAVERQLAATRSKLQRSESKIAEMKLFKQRNEQLTHQLGQERQRTRQKDEKIAELEQREEMLQRQLRTLTLQRDEAPARKDMCRQMRQLQIREDAIGQVLAAVAGTAGVVNVPSRAWDDEHTVRSRVWQQPLFVPEPEPEPEPQRDMTIQHTAMGIRSPQPPDKRPNGKGPRKQGRMARRRRPGKSKLRGKKDQIEQMKRRLRAMSYSSRGQDPASVFALYDSNNSGSLNFQEFKSSVRKGGKLTRGLISDTELETLFSSVDADGNGTICIRELTKFLWGEDEKMIALLEHELQGFAKVLDTSSDDNDEVDLPEAQQQVQAGKVNGKDEGVSCGDTRETNPATPKLHGHELDHGQGASTGPCARGSRSLYCGTTGRLLRQPNPRKKTSSAADLSPKLVMPTPEELTQLSWGSSKLIDGQQYWFSFSKPADLHWTIPPELAAALRRLRAEVDAKEAGAAATAPGGEEFYIASAFS